jgi:hypothetical protein
MPIGRRTGRATRRSSRRTIERYFGPAEKINITVPGLILKRIDDYAVRRGESRSGFLVRAAEEAIRKSG